MTKEKIHSGIKTCVNISLIVKLMKMMKQQYAEIIIEMTQGFWVEGLPPTQKPCVKYSTDTVYWLSQPHQPFINTKSIYFY